jgi:energy-coupling factor transport system ATP-binding protein
VAEPPLVEVERLTFRYRRATEPAIIDLSLSVAPGEILLVAGPSGCGKSTLIRSMNGLIPHAYPGELTGEVRVAGRPTTELRLREIAQTVGTVLQDPAKQIVGATVESELAFGPENLGLPREDIRARLDRVADEAGVGDLLGRETAALSGGERQLIATAGILMMEPQLYVVDEPLANLDPATAARLLALLRRLADAGNGIVIVEHRVEEGLELRPDRVLYLDAGRATYLGPVGGFLSIADPGAVKLPFEVVLERARRGELEVAEELAVQRRDAQDRVEEPPRLEFRAVTAGFGEREVLHGIDARLGAREVVAVLGPNGSGKTTLFRVAIGLLSPWSGDVLVDGASTKGRSVAELVSTFGYVFQSPSQMLFARTVREELLFGPRNLRRAPETFDGILEDALTRTGLADLEGILDRPPLSLSFGQQKRLALAIALALAPRTLILDEPSSGQDHRTARLFMSEVRAIPGLESLYFITHDVDLALTHADRILLCMDGQVVADGPPRRVIEDAARWRACNLRYTSLARANLERLDPTGPFLDAEPLARLLAASGAASDSPAKGGLPVDRA